MVQPAVHAAASFSPLPQQDTWAMQRPLTLTPPYPFRTPHGRRSLPPAVRPKLQACPTPALLRQYVLLVLLVLVPLNSQSVVGTAPFGSPAVSAAAEVTFPAPPPVAPGTKSSYIVVKDDDSRMAPPVLSPPTQFPSAPDLVAIRQADSSALTGIPQSDKLMLTVSWSERDRAEGRDVDRELAFTQLRQQLAVLLPGLQDAGGDIHGPQAAVTRSASDKEAAAVPEDRTHMDLTSPDSPHYAINTALDIPHYHLTTQLSQAGRRHLLADALPLSGIASLAELYGLSTSQITSTASGTSGGIADDTDGASGTKGAPGPVVPLPARIDRGALGTERGAVPPLSSFAKQKPLRQQPMRWAGGGRLAQRQSGRQEGALFGKGNLMMVNNVRPPTETGAVSYKAPEVAAPAAQSAVLLRLPAGRVPTSAPGWTGTVRSVNGGIGGSTDSGSDGITLSNFHLDEDLYDMDYVIPSDESLQDNVLFDPLYRIGMTPLECGDGCDAGSGPLPGLCLAPHAPMVAQLAQPLHDDDYDNDFGTAVHGTPEAVYGPAGQLDALRAAVVLGSNTEPKPWLAGPRKATSRRRGAPTAQTSPAASNGVRNASSVGRLSRAGGNQTTDGSAVADGGSSSGTSGSSGSYISNNVSAAATGGNATGISNADNETEYVDYSNRVLYSFSARLFGTPYPISMYAGLLYLAEADPLLVAEGQAARAGLLLDYYVTSNYYIPFSFARAGPSAVATWATTARVRGQIGVAAKARALAQALVNFQRSRYQDNNVEVAVGTRALATGSVGGYLFNNPLVNNQFLLQGPTLGP